MKTFLDKRIDERIYVCDDSYMGNHEMRETIRQMLADWNAATDEQREAMLAAVA